MQTCFSGSAHDAAMPGHRNLFRSLIAIVALLICALSTASAQGQTAAHCVIHGDATLAMVVQWINTQSESRTITLISVCRMGFALDATAIDRIGATKASPAVIEALNKATAINLSLDQAQSQVKDLQHRVDDVDAGVNKDRDAALAKLDADYQAQRDKAGACKPKDQFETTAQYEARCQASKSSQSALDDQHQADRQKVTASFAAKAADKDAPYRKRITYLEGAAYPDLDAAIYGSYAAGSGTLSAKVGDQDYIFEKVPADTADNLVKNWQKVKITRPFTEDDSLTRNLVFGPISISGYSKTAHDAQVAKHNQATAAEEVAQAQDLMNQKRYADAQTWFTHALTLDPANQAAQTGLDAAKAAISNQEARIKQEGEAGEWTDPHTSLMWSIYDNHKSVNWKNANEYCQNLRTGNNADWRLPTIDELHTLYDPTSNRNTAPLQKAETYTDYGQLKFDARGTTWPYHAKETVLLSGPSAWSATKDDSQGIDEAKMLFFANGQIETVPVGYTRTMRALCVRDTVAHPAANMQAAQQAPPPKPAHKPIDVQVFNEYLHDCNAGSAEACQMTGYSYERGDGVDKDLKAAVQYYQKGCTLGHRGCAQAQVLASKIAWQQ